MFELAMSTTVMVALGVMGVSLLYLLVAWCPKVASVSRRVDKDSRIPLDADGESLPGISVIVYSNDDASNLEILLPQILGQDYPAPFEVIVVNDGASASTKDVIARLEHDHPNLYMTFTPVDSRAVSRKKLAVTLGVKAARYGITVHTTGNCQVPSRMWLRAIGRRFTPGTDVVIGYAAPAAAADVKGERRAKLHAFDTVWTAVEYLSWAIAGHPYRGTCHNLSYRSSVFFDTKGFSRSLNLKYGDDDVFVSQVANGNNTVVELAADSMLLSVEEDPAAAHRADKLRRTFTSGMVKGHAGAFFGSCLLAWWLSLAGAVVAAVAGWPSMIPAAIALASLLVVWIVMMIVWRRTSHALWSRTICLTLPWLMTIYPFYNLWYSLRGMAKRESNYSWT